MAYTHLCVQKYTRAGIISSSIIIKTLQLSAAFCVAAQEIVWCLEEFYSEVGDTCRKVQRERGASTITGERRHKINDTQQWKRGGKDLEDFRALFSHVPGKASVCLPDLSVCLCRHVCVVIVFAGRFVRLHVRLAHSNIVDTGLVLIPHTHPVEERI